MKVINKSKKDIEKYSLIKFSRQYGKTRMMINKILGIPIEIKEVKI